MYLQEEEADEKRPLLAAGIDNWQWQEDKGDFDMRMMVKAFPGTITTTHFFYTFTFSKVVDLQCLEQSVFSQLHHCKCRHVRFILREECVLCFDFVRVHDNHQSNSIRHSFLSGRHL